MTPEALQLLAHNLLTLSMVNPAKGYPTMDDHREAAGAMKKVLNGELSGLRQEAIDIVSRPQLVAPPTTRRPSGKSPGRNSRLAAADLRLLEDIRKRMADPKYKLTVYQWCVIGGFKSTNSIRQIQNKGAGVIQMMSMPSRAKYIRIRDWDGVTLPPPTAVAQRVQRLVDEEVCTLVRVEKTGKVGGETLRMMLAGSEVGAKATQRVLDAVNTIRAEEKKGDA